MKCSIVIPTMTDELVQKCIASIEKYTDMDDVEIIVVANGGDFKNGDVQKMFPQPYVKLVWYIGALGAVKAYNEGIKYATGDYVLLMNDDCLVQESPKNWWIDELIKPFGDADVAVTGLFRMVPGLGGNDLKFNLDKLNYGFILFFCAMIPKRIFNEIGLLDEKLKCGVDVDFCMKAKERGYRIVQVPEEKLDNSGQLAIGSFPFYHQGEGTVHDHYGHEAWKKILKEDAAVLNERYGVKTTIVIPAHGNHLEDLKKCISSIETYTDLNYVEIIVVANGCPPETKDYLGGKPSIKTIWHDSGLGFPVAVNVGLTSALGQNIIVLNQDVVILGKDWLDMLVAPLTDKVGITGAFKGTVEGLDYEFIPLFCAGIRKEVIDGVGLLDSVFTPGGFEDIDFSIRAQNAGWEIMSVPHSAEYSNGQWAGGLPVYHVEHHDEWLKSDDFEKNKKIIFDRYLGKKSRGIIIPSWPVAQKKGELIELQNFLKDYEIKKVLEVGTYRGGTAMLWANIVAPVGGHVFCADMKFDWGAFQDHGYANDENKYYRRQVYNDSPFEQYVTEIQGDTHDVDFVRGVHLGVGVVDFIFIDGDHSYEGVKQDFENYKDMVKPGGYIAFHDILESDYHKEFGCHVHQFWNEIKDKYKSWEFIDRNEYPGCPLNSMGIGVIKMDENVVLEHVDVTLPEVTAYISTKDRYHTTLPMAIVGIASQTHKPAELIIIDDGEQKDLRNDAVYSSLFKMLDENRIKWKVLFGQKKGQVANHQMMLTAASHNYIWRVDDDNYPEARVLETLLNKLVSDDKIGAVASRSTVPGETVPYGSASSLIGDLYTKPNIQWSYFPGFVEVDHLHNTFLFRKQAGTHGYHQGLSPVGHREETMFTYQMKLNGWKLFVCGDVTTWHFRQSSGGIRSFTNQSMWDSDEQIFKQWMRNIEINKDEFIAVLDAGLGDHLDFLSILPEIRAKYPGKSITLATCFREVFNDEPDVKQISIAEAHERLGNTEHHNIYKWMAENNWTSNIKDAYRRMYL